MDLPTLNSCMLDRISLLPIPSAISSCQKVTLKLHHTINYCFSLVLQILSHVHSLQTILYLPDSFLSATVPPLSIANILPASCTSHPCTHPPVNQQPLKHSWLRSSLCFNFLLPLTSLHALSPILSCTFSATHADHPNTQQMSEDEANTSADIPRRRRSNPHVNQPSENTFLNLSHFWPYRWLHYVQNDLPALSAFIKVCLLLTVIAQLPFIVPILDLSVHHSANQCSCISLDKRFFMYTTVFLYFFTRSLLPLITVWAFSSAVISKLGTQSSAFASDFLKQSNIRTNETVFRAVVHIFWDVRLAETRNSIGKTLTRQLEEKLKAMCITSILEAITITLILVQVGSTRFALDVYSISFGGVLDGLIVCVDALSYFTLILTIGIICSFFSHEATMNCLVAGAVALEDHADSFSVQPSKELITLAKSTVNNFNNRWSIIEIFLFLSVQLYTLILVFFAGAGLPLSYGVTAHMYTEQMHLYWFPFVIIFSVGHFLSTCVWPSAHGASEYRVIGVLLKAFLLVIVYIVQPPLFGSFLQILFVVMPAAYLFWYLWMKVHYENSVRSAKPRGWRRRHERNMGIYICLMAQLIVAIILSIFSEYSIMRVKPEYVG